MRESDKKPDPPARTILLTEGGGNFSKNHETLFYLLVVNLQMGDQADQAVAQGKASHSRLRKAVHPLLCGSFRPQVDHVGLDRLVIHRKTGDFRQSLSQTTGPPVVFPEASEVVIQGIQPAAARFGLAMPPPKSLRQRWARSMKDCDPTKTLPTGAPSPLDRQTETESNPLTKRAADSSEGADRIEQTGSVQMQATIRFLGKPANFFEDLKGITGSPSPVGSVLQADQTGIGIMASAPR